MVPPMPILRLVPVVLLFLVLAVASCQAMRSEAGLESSGASPAGCVVTHVIDGDTIEMLCPSGGEFRARLIGLDAPEIRDARCASEARLGREATVRLRALVTSGAEIGARFEGMDRFGRRLVELEVGGRDVADILVSEGLATRYHGGPRPDWCAQPI
jgi:micrococcal nuclease